MNKTVILLLLFIGLGGAAFWYSQQETKSTEKTLGWDFQFKIEDVDEIHKIFIARRDGVNTTLERISGDKWLYNGKYPARPNAIDQMLDVIKNIRMKSVPPKNAIKTMVDDIATNGVKVEIYNKAGKNMKTYYLGGVTPDERGTYMIMEGSEQPLVGELPLLEGGFRGRFEMEGDDWRDKAVFEYELGDLKFVSIEFPKQKNKSFKLQIEGDEYTISPYYELTAPIKKPIVKGSVESFLIGFNRQVAENFVNDSPEKSRVGVEIPFAHITTIDKNDIEKQVTLYPIENESNSPVVRYLARLKTDKTDDLLLMQHRNVKKILRAYQGFY